MPTVCVWAVQARSGMRELASWLPGESICLRDFDTLSGNRIARHSGMSGAYLTGKHGAPFLIDVIWN